MDNLFYLTVQSTFFSFSNGVVFVHPSIKRRHGIRRLNRFGNFGSLSLFTEYLQQNRATVGIIYYKKEKLFRGGGTEVN